MQIACLFAVVVGCQGAAAPEGDARARARGEVREKSARVSLPAHKRARAHATLGLRFSCLQCCCPELLQLHAESAGCGVSCFRVFCGCCVEISKIV